MSKPEVQSSTKRPRSQPDPAPQTPYAERLEQLRKSLRSGPNKKAFWRQLKDKAEELGWKVPSYASVRVYHYDRAPTVDYLKLVSATFGESLEYLATGERPSTPTPFELDVHKGMILKQAVTEVMGLRGTPFGAQEKYVPYWFVPLGELWIQLMGAPGPTKDPETMIAKALMGPLKAFGINPARMDMSTLGHYALAMLSPLLFAAEQRSLLQRREAALLDGLTPEEIKQYHRESRKHLPTEEADDA